MDKNYLSALEDTNSSITKKISLIKKYISEYTLSRSSSDKNNILSKIDTEFKGMETDLKLMKRDIECLQESSNKQTWEEKYSSMKLNKKNLKKKIEDLKLNKNNINDINNDDEDYMNVNKNVDLTKLSSQQVMKRGDILMDDTDKSLKNMIKTLGQGRSMMKETNKELNKQVESMDRIDGDLNEIDGSLNRGKKTINDMNKMNNCLIW